MNLPDNAAGSTEPLTAPTGPQLLAHAARQWPDSEAIVYPHARRTFRELSDGALRNARALIALGVQPGQRVGILMPNCPEFLETFFACHLVGAAPVTINARYKPGELRHVSHDAQLAVIVTTDLIADFAPFADLLASAFSDGRPASLRHLVMLGSAPHDGYLDREAMDRLAQSVPPERVSERSGRVTPDAIAVVMYTSGTTAAPRGCPLTHRALFRTAVSVADRFELTDTERFWNPLPLFHMGGLLPTMANLYRGGTTVSQVHFEADIALRQFEDEKITFAYPTFPTITQAIIHHPQFAHTNLSRIRCVLDVAPPQVLAAVESAFPAAKVVTSYGLTEAGGVITYGHLDDPAELRFTTAGRPFPGMRVRVVDPDTGHERAPGQVGELRVAGVGMFDGYLNDPGHTAARTDEQGYLCTGDLGALDEAGRVSYAGRVKDMLKVGGENVAAAEIEAQLALHPAVKIAQVVGVPDGRLVEVAAAFVELVDGASVTEGELIRHCQAALASFKVPRYIRFVRDWPLSTTKIQKFRLREQIRAEIGENTTAPPLRPVNGPASQAGAVGGPAVIRP